MKNTVIGICDDDILTLNSLKGKIERYIQENKWNAEIFTFQSGMELLIHVLKLDIVFLDIEMLRMDGINIGEINKNKNRHCKIVTITNNIGGVKESLKINAFRCITKPFVIEEIEEALKAARNLQIGIETIELYEKRKQYSIRQKEIKYIISYDGYSEFKVENRVFRKEISLNKLEKIMDKRLFFRINRQYIVNLIWVKNYKDGIIMVEEKEMYISRRKKKSFEQVYLEYDLKYREDGYIG